MLSASTISLLRSIVRALEVSEKPAWDDLVESCQELLYEMHQMTRQTNHAHNGSGLNGGSRTVLANVENLRRALPDAKSMVAAIRRRNRDAALECGRAALTHVAETPRRPVTLESRN